MKPGILDFIALLGLVNNGKDDSETQKLIKKIIFAIKNKKRKEWPDKDLRAMYNQMEKIQKQWLLQTLIDMDKAIDESYAILEENNETLV